MMRKLLFVLGSFFIFFNCVATFAHEPRNLELVKQDLIRYHQSGEYESDQSLVVAQAMHYLQTRLQHRDPNSKLAIVFDIDDTSLSNYTNLQKLHFGGTFSDISHAEDEAQDPAIKPTLNLYRYAKAHDLAIFFITGRTEKSRTATESNLRQAGFESWNGLFFKPENYNQRSAIPYKSAVRKQLIHNGYTIILNIGDQESDLAGGNAEKTFKLPNPYYLIP